MVHIEQDKCIGCGNCVDVCPNEVLEMVDGFCMWAHPNSCEHCGICEVICHQEAITVDSEELKV